jgi:hypothetical protein
MELSEILEVTDDLTRPRWVECREVPGFALLMRLPDVPGLRTLALQPVREALEQAKKAAESGAEVQLEVDPGAIGLKLSEYAILDWRGLTGQGLRRLAAGAENLKIKAPAEVEIPFNRQVLEALLKWSPRFYEFVDRAWKEMEGLGLQGREADEKNLSSAPDTTLTPPPGSVPGAGAKKKGSGLSRPAKPAGGPSGIPETT